MVLPRLLRTSTIASIADYGAMPGIPLPGPPAAALAAANALAFRNALASTARRISIPEGSWWIGEILFGGNQWLPAGTEVFGEGETRTLVYYRPTNVLIPLFRFPPGLSRCVVRDMQILGNDLVSPRTGRAISFEESQINRVRDVQIWYFDRAVMFNEATGFSGYNVLERFEINDVQVGIYGRAGSNSLDIRAGRILGALNPSNTGYGIDLSGAFDPVSGPGGPQGVVIENVAIENANYCIRLAACLDVAIVGCYLEPLGPTGMFAHRVLDVDEFSENVDVVGSINSLPNPPPGEENATPTYVAAPPEARGAGMDSVSFPATGTAWGIRGFGSTRAGAAAPYRNRIRNADMSRDQLYWTSTGTLLVAVATGASDYVTGRRSLRLTSGVNPDSYISQTFEVDAGVRSVTAIVRYAITLGAPAFRFDVWDVTGTATRLGYYADVQVAAGWRVRALTVRFDGVAATGVQGPRRLQLRIYPYQAAIHATGREVLVDSAWVVDGECAAPYRAYDEGVEVLAGDDRTVLFSGTTTVDVPPTALPASLRVPTNVTGVVVEVTVSGTQASSFQTILRINDNTGTDSIRNVHAVASGRPTLVEYTVPMTFDAAPGPQFSVVVTDPANSVTYAVRLKQWILRPQ